MELFQASYRGPDELDPLDELESPKDFTPHLLQHSTLVLVPTRAFVEDAEIPLVRCTPTTLETVSSSQGWNLDLDREECGK